ncbi:MAG: hypothetical protein QMD10_10630, partial [Desulfitobacteriaceae bacterium]|nr:hypothetical protein [Desulfitobacteriaceae bacterium]
YYKTKSGKWIYRMLKSILEVAGEAPFRRRPGKIGFKTGRRAMMAAFNRRMATEKKQRKLELD